jgi:hypothetical protein
MCRVRSVSTRSSTRVAPSVWVAMVSTALESRRDTCERAETMTTIRSETAASSRIEITVRKRSGVPTVVPPNLNTTRGEEAGSGALDKRSDTRDGKLGRKASLPPATADFWGVFLRIQAAPRALLERHVTVSRECESKARGKAGRPCLPASCVFTHKSEVPLI